MPHKLTKTQKKSFWSVIFSSSTWQWTISLSDYDVQLTVDFIQTIGSVAGVRRSSKTLPESNLHQKEVMVSVWLSAAGLTYYSFLYPGKTLHLRSMLSNLMSCTKNCNAYSWLWSTERAQFFSTTTSDCMSHNQGFTSWTNWATKFCLIRHVLNNFLHAKHFRNQQDAENAFQEFVESQGIDFYAKGINKLISCWWKCVDCNGSYCN